MEALSIYQKIAVWALPLIFAVVFHEIAHGWVANKLGDPTARMLGRLSPNPIKHIDPIGTVLLPLLMLTYTNFVFGWAKPVPVNYANLRQPKRDMMLVALAGPFMNLLMAFGWIFLLKLTVMFGSRQSDITRWTLLTAQIGVLINIVLMVLNLLPIPPLDGSRVVNALLPNKLSYWYNRIEPFGIFILLLLLMSGVLGVILKPMVYTALSFVRAIAGI